MPRASKSGGILRFTFLFVLFLLGFYFLYEMRPLRELREPAREWTASAASSALGVLRVENVRLRDTVELKGGTHAFQIIDECTGIFAIMIYLAFVLAFPCGFRERAVGALLGIVVLLVLNLARLVAAGIILRYSPEVFVFVHDYVWQIVFIFIAVGLAFGWAYRTIAGPRSPVGFAARRGAWRTK